MRRLHLVLLLGTLVGSIACSGSGSLTGPATDSSFQAALANGQEPGSRNGRTLLLQGQEPSSSNTATSSGSGQEPGSRN
jgi:hypothetical protein